jgi:hypothetical protein
MQSKNALMSGWSDHYKLKNPAAVTFVFNNDNHNFKSAKDTLRQFHRLMDERRLGHYFYKRKSNQRLDFLVSPEKFDCGHPHYHGIIAIPEQELSDRQFHQVAETYQQAWRQVADAGSLELKPLFDAVGWLEYSSKENCISTSDRTIWSISDFVSTRV